MVAVIENNDRRVRYVVSNPLGQAVFIYDFEIVPTTDSVGLKVYIDDELIDDTDYTIDDVASTVTLDTAAAQNSIVVIEGDTVAERELNYPLRGGLPSSRLNNDANKIYYMIQELLRDRTRSLMLAPSAGSGISTAIPAPQAGKAVIGNATANGFINGPTADEIEAAQGYAEDAATSQAAAAVSETNAAASANLAAALADSILWNDIVYNTATPYSVTQASNGVLIVIDTSGGNKVVNLPTISGLTLPFNVGIQKSTSDANTLTINRGGSDTVDGATSLVIDSKGGVTLTADTDGTPDNWAVFRFGLVADTSITNAKLATMPTGTIKTNISGITSSPSDASLTQLLDALVGNTRGNLIMRGASNWAALAAGAANTFLRANGAAADLSFSSLNSVVTVRNQSFTSSGTYTPSAGMLYCIAEVLGGGGGGGGGNGAPNFAGGGGAGGYGKEILSAATVGASQSVTIGAGGAGGISNQAGGTGGTSSLGALISCTGGVGGTLGITSPVQGGLGGTSSGGDVNSQGAPGFYSLPSVSVSGAGASSPYGGGGRAILTAGNGSAGTGFGSGGSGSAGAANGGAGAPGIVIITEFCSQ